MIVDDIKERIIQKLAVTETQYKVKIPLAIESGSRGWGFASPDSDYDCRFVYVRPLDWYLTVFDKKDIIEYAADPIFDVNGWDIKKVLRHIVKSNAVMFEWLSSNEIYISNPHITDLLQGLAKDFFNPIAVSCHYLSIARNKLSEILSEDETKLKRYFYVLRPIANLNYIHQYGRMPYMEYDRTLAKTDVAPEILSAINELRQVKAVSNEGYKIKRDERLVTYFQKEIELFTQRLSNMRFEKNRDYSPVDVVFKEIIERVWTDEHW